MKTLYLAGPMTGHPNDNYPLFNTLATRLRERGYIVHNPADNFGQQLGLPKGTYIRAAIMLLLQSDGIALIPGWKHSEGATLEAFIAQQLGLFAIDANSGKSISLSASVAQGEMYRDSAFIRLMSTTPPPPVLTNQEAAMIAYRAGVDAGDRGVTVDTVRNRLIGLGANIEDLNMGAVMRTSGLRHVGQTAKASHAAAKRRRVVRWYA